MFLGVDAGGTHTRCLLVDESGQTLGHGTGPGANPNSARGTVDALAEALRSALVETGDSVEIASAVVGGAGAGPARQPEVAEAVRAAADRAGLAIDSLLVCSDCEIAFAAGSIAPRGTVLIAGTGAIAAAIERFAVVRRRDGHGYLLGDAGSGFAIGLAAARAVLAALEQAGPDTALREPVVARLRADESVRPELDDVQAIVAAGYAHPPAWLAGLAPLVDQAASAGDAVAGAIADDAVRALVRTASAVRVDPAAPLVITGGVSTGDGYLGLHLRDALQRELDAVPRVVRDGTIGAAALALRSAGRHSTADSLVEQGDSARDQLGE